MSEGRLAKLSYARRILRGAYLRLVASQRIALSPSEERLSLDVCKRIQAAGMTVDEAAANIRRQWEAVEAVE